MNPTLKIARSQLLRLLDGFRVQVATPVGLWELESQADAPWQPLVRGPVPQRIVDLHNQVGGGGPPIASYFNDVYGIFVFELGDGGLHLSIKRNDRAAVRNWRHFQQIKNEIAGPEVEAVEIFPRESRLADNANQYHLWCLPEGVDVPIGFEGGFVTITDEDVEAWNSQGGKGRQEPMQEGLTVGAAMQAEQERRGLGAAKILARGLNTNA
jgi:hypothetical protein